MKTSIKKLSIFSRIMLRYAGLITLVGTAITVFGTYYSIQLYKNLRTDIEELLPTDARSGKDLAQLTHRLESIDNLAILVFSKDTEASKRFVLDLSKRLDALPKDLAASVEYRIADEMKFFQKRLGLYLEVSDLMKVRDYVRDRIKFDKEMYNPLNIFPVTDRLKKPELDFDALHKKYQRTGSYESFPDGFYATPDSTKRVVVVYMAGRHSDIHKALELSHKAKDIVAELQPTKYAADMQVLYTGGVQNFIEEHEALVADLTLSTIIVVILVTLVMWVFYRDFVGTSSLIFSLFMGTLWTFGVAYFAVGYLNANSAFLGSIVIGNGINFGIIFLGRYVEERRRHRGFVRSLDTAMRSTATATWTAALAAGLSYGSLVLTRFRGFKQFGIIGLIGMVLCWITAFTLLPALLTLGEKWLKPKYKFRPAGEGLVANAIATFVGKFPKPICLVAVVVSVLSIATFARFSPDLIETNLSNLRNKESMEHGAGYLDRYLIEIFHHYLTPTVVLAKSREDAVKLAEAYREQKKKEGPDSLIASVQIFDDFIPSHQDEKFPLLRDLRKMMTPQVVASLEPKERGWVEEFLTDETFSPVTENNIPALIRTKFTEKDGSLGRLVLVEPPLTDNGNTAWDGKKLIGFVHELRRIADEVSPGTPVAGQLPISADMVESISEDGPRATLFAFIAVVLLVVVLFRQWKTISRVLFALMLGVLWLAGYILGFKLKINFLNFIALPITFGIGVDYGVNVFQRYRLEGSGKILEVIRHTGGAVLLASLTTIIGYSSLLIAQNQAFVSFGRLAVMGEITCIIAAVVVLPAYLIYKSRGKAVEATAPMVSESETSTSPSGA